MILKFYKKYYKGVIENTGRTKYSAVAGTLGFKQVSKYLAMYGKQQVFYSVP